MSSAITATLFLGPTLPRRLAAQKLADTGIVADFRPPVAQGDVYRAVQDRPAAIVMIDGFFEAVPAVWHKEVLYALSQGIAVFGASSMGALRAAELHPFGMVGVGKVFADYRDGVLEDDDEVAVIHGPAELGYPALSEAMVNIRATVAAAIDANVIGVETGNQLIGAVKALPYRARNVDTLASAAATHSPDLVAWLRSERVDQKRLDALAALDALIDWKNGGARRPTVRFHFERTSLFASMIEDGDVTHPAQPYPARTGPDVQR